MSVRLTIGTGAEEGAGELERGADEGVVAVEVAGRLVPAEHRALRLADDADLQAEHRAAGETAGEDTCKHEAFNLLPFTS